MLGPKVVDYLGNIRKCGLVGGAVSLGVMGGVRFQKSTSFQSVLCLVVVVLTCKLSATAPVSCLPACCHVLYQVSHGLTLRNWKQRP